MNQRLNKNAKNPLLLP